MRFFFFQIQQLFENTNNKKKCQQQKLTVFINGRSAQFWYDEHVKFYSSKIDACVRFDSLCVCVYSVHPEKITYNLGTYFKSQGTEKMFKAPIFSSVWHFVRRKAYRLFGSNSPLFYFPQKLCMEKFIMVEIK